MPVAIVEENRGVLSKFCQLIKAGDLETVLKQLRTPEDQQRFAEEGLAWMAKNAPEPAPVLLAPVAAPVVANLSEQHSGELDQVRTDLADTRADLADVRGRLHIANNRADALQRQVDDMGSRQELQSLRLSALATELEKANAQLAALVQLSTPPPTEQPSAGPTEQAAPVPMVGKDDKAPRRSAKDT